MATRRSSYGLSPKAGAAGATSTQARAAAFDDRLSQLENDMAEIRDGTMKDVLVKLRLLSDEIEKIKRRFGTVDRTGNRYESDLADLRRQVERGSTPLPPHQTSRREHSRSLCTLGNAVAYLGF